MSLAVAGGVTAAPDAAARPWLIVNPHSFRASRRGLAGRIAAHARSHGLHVIEARDLGEFHTALDRLRDRCAGQIWMLAGDGTVHATAQYLARAGQCRLVAGAAAAGWRSGKRRAAGLRRISTRQRFGAALEALREGRSLAEERLLTLRIEQEGAEAQHGFFLAGAVIYAGIRLCQEHRAQGSGWLHRSWFADPYCLLKVATRVWAGRSPLPPYDDLQVRTDGAAAMHAPMRMLLVSTLQFREALYNPFAERGEGAVRLTAVAASARHFWRHLPAMFRGRFSDNMTLQQGYLSGRFASAEVLGMSGYALDGELFATDPARPTRLCTGIELRVLRP